MMLGIHPVHPVPSIVDGQSIGPEEVCIGNDAPIRTIHAGVLNARSVAPICPVDGAIGRRGKPEVWEVEALQTVPSIISYQGKEQAIPMT